MKSSLLFIFSLWICLSANAQQISGIVVENNGAQTPLVGAALLWLGTSSGTVTDPDGRFSLTLPENSTDRRLIVSYVGYVTDTITVTGQNFLKIALQSGQQLDEFVAKSDKADLISPVQTEIISTADLRKAACCNLSESFETNASVDVSFTDAVTGAKQIQMLGLDGIYTQITTENIPSVRGLAARSGLYFIPGTWITSIDVAKGAGSVVNGYESITGQINVEMAKPEHSDRLFFNAYTNSGGRVEGNLQLAQKFNPKWSTGLLLHASSQLMEMDGNDDGFTDVPMFTQFNLVNRWKYIGKNREAQFGVKALYEDKTGGQIKMDMSGNGNGHQHGTDLYRVRFDNRKAEAFGKVGFLSKKDGQSLGLIFSAMHHDLRSGWGYHRYNAQQNYALANAIFQTKFSEKHFLKAGGSFTVDNYDEVLNDSAFSRHELVGGIFTEYTFVIPNRFTAVAGIRADRHNLFGNIFTPRLHLKYDIGLQTVLRASAGRGFRVANVIVENNGFLASSRQLEIRETLRPEIAWNYGASLTHKFRLGKKQGSIIADFYRTDFVNQVIIDLDSDPGKVSFYNLQDKSFANSFQVSASYEAFEHFNMTMAYKYYDVKTTINNKLVRMPFIAQNRFFANFAYELPRWKFDLTAQWFGHKRLPNTSGNPAEHQRSDQSPGYMIFNSQVTKVFKKWEWYLGVENIGNFRQPNAIVAANDPFGKHFDAGMIWGPIMGRMVYTGMRLAIK